MVTTGSVARKPVKYRKYTRSEWYRSRERYEGGRGGWVTEAWRVEENEGGIRRDGIVASSVGSGAALLASARLGRQFLSDRVFLWEPDYHRFPTPRSPFSLSLSFSLCPSVSISLSLSVRFLPFVSPPSGCCLPSPRSLLSCRFPRDVSERRRPIGAPTELWSETEDENEPRARQTGKGGRGWQRGV